MTLMPSSSHSPLDAALARVGDRWTLLVVDALLGGPRRFNELIEEVRGIAPNVLSQRLKHLEREAMITPRRYSEHPPRAAYELTAAGRELAGALRLLAQWGARASEQPDALRHTTCGTLLEARWYCPTCARIVDDPDDDDELRYA
jgi:DNA-binding HxlR family transcriptional regulator